MRFEIEKNLNIFCKKGLIYFNRGVNYIKVCYFL